jgi:hypothetical protein
MGAYQSNDILTTFHAVRVDFVHFFSIAVRLSSLVDYIDERTQAKWDTTASVAAAGDNKVE